MTECLARSIRLNKLEKKNGCVSIHFLLYSFIQLNGIIKLMRGIYFYTVKGGGKNGTEHKSYV